MMEQDDHPEMNREKPELMTEENFLKELYYFMKQRDTPIERIPHLGFKQINLFMMFKAVMEIGGYHQVTAQQLWKKVYNILGGNPRSTSAATCTRRHYEKLLLPYEYHLAGYGDNIPITPPRQRKRFRDEEYNMSAKRPDFTHLHQFNQEQTHLFNQFIPPGPLSLNTYWAVSMPPIPNLTSPLPTRPNVSYLPPSPIEPGTIKQPLEYLRHLAQEYKSSSGWTEPLNLSKKPSALEVSGNAPSSFTAPATKKNEPKFLNKAPGLNLGNPSMQGISEAPQAAVNPKCMDESQVINLTSSSSSSTSSSLWKIPPRSSPQRITYPSAVHTKNAVRGPQVTAGKLGPSIAPQSGPEPVTPSFPLDPNTGMEIQIPLSLLQNWIKEGLILSPPFTRQHLPLHKPPPSPERTSSEPSDSSSFDHPADLSLRRSDISTDSTSANIRQAAQINSFSHVKPLQIPFYAHAPHLKSPGFPDREKSTKQVHPTRIHEQGLKSTAHVKDAAHTSAKKPEKEPEKILPAVQSPLARVNALQTSAPFFQIAPEHLKLLFSNAPFRLERGKIC